MPAYKYEITKECWDAIQAKADRSRTTPQELLDQQVQNFCMRVYDEHRNAQRQALIAVIAAAPETALDGIAKLLDKQVSK